jgi:hypothetical protein
MFIVPFIVFGIALLLDLSASFVWAVLGGLGFVVGGVVLWEFVSPSTVETEQDTIQTGANGRAIGPTFIEALMLQALTLLLFANLLDSGVHLRACCYAWLGYGAGVAIVLVSRSKTLTKSDLFYLKWGWAVIIMFGVPVFIRVWKAKGLL